ncbi:MAG: hypothetical protein KGM18_04785 [Sphingomonadales bacterium]|nr:hypothetical protein [Sphingomonadales bacterium]
MTRVNSATPIATRSDTTTLRTIRAGSMMPNMMRWLALSSAVILFGAPVVASPAANLKSVFAAHDPYDRLPNTAIRALGTVRVKSSTYSIYYLEFVNPVSHHGQQRIAIIKNGMGFAGAYQCTLGPGDAKLIIGRDRFTVWVQDIHEPFVVKFDQRGPTRNAFFCGEGSGWEDSI